MTSPAASSTGLATGVVLDNRYRLGESIGDGGMGKVWEAEQLSLGQTVAIKVLHGNVMYDDEPRARFAREARVMAQLGDMSRHITRVFEHGVLEDGVPYLVMERLRGEGLDACLKREKVLPIGRVADVIEQLCKALAVAHAEGIVHRDLKPANIFLCTDEDGCLWVKLLDFGVAKALAEVGEQTGKDQVIGTPNYMSPEQLQTDATIDHRADLFAVGTIAYRLATGRVAFGKGTMQEMAQRILSATPAAPTSINPSLPRSFDEFITKAIAKSPADRFQSARELSEALRKLVDEHVAGGSRVSALRLDPASESVPSAALSLAPSSKKASKGSSGTIIAVVLAIAAVVVGFLFWRGGHEGAGAPPQSEHSALVAPQEGQPAAQPQKTAEPSPEAVPEPAASGEASSSDP